MAGEVSRLEAGLRYTTKELFNTAHLEGHYQMDLLFLRMIIPLLEAAGNLLQADELDPIAWASAKAALRKELDSWNKCEQDSTEYER